MSVIVATSDYMVGDCRLSVESGEKQQPHTKIFRNKHLIAGGSGYFKSIIALKVALADGYETPEDLVDIVDKDSEYIVICKKTGHLYVVTNEYALRCKKKVLGTGTGAECALAYMAGKGSLSLDCAQKALRYTFTVRADCGDGVRTLKRGV